MDSANGFPAAGATSGAAGPPVSWVGITRAKTDDVFYIDDTSLLFDGLKVRVRAKKGPLCKVEDVSGDLIPVLVCQVETALFMIEPGQGTAELTGETFYGIAIVGEDSIEIVP